LSEVKRYYWLKLQDGFFGSKRIKKLRKMAGGDTYTIIYLKMQLLAMKTDGVLTFTGLESEFADELALDLDEAPDDVRVTLAYLLSCGLAETSDNISFFFPWAVANTGSEGSSAERMRNKRAAEKLKASHCAELCEHRDGEKEKDIEIDTEEEKEIEGSRGKEELSTGFQQSFQQEDFETLRERALRRLANG
jgi:predicted phage replisome organizer